MKEPGTPQVQEPGENKKPVESDVIDWSAGDRWRLEQARRHADDTLFDAEKRRRNQEAGEETKSGLIWVTEKKPQPTNGEGFAPDEMPKPPEVAEGIMEEVFKREVEESEQAAIAGARRVFDVGGNPGEVAEARNAGMEFLLKLGTLVRKTLKEAGAATVAGVGEAFSPVTKAADWVADNLITKKWWKEEDWSLPDEIRAANEARINEKYAKYCAEEAGRKKTETPKPVPAATETAAVGAPAELSPATPPTTKPHYLNQLRENLDVQLRTLARTTDNPEERRKVEEKIAEFEAAIRKEDGGASNTADKSRTTAPLAESTYTSQLRENLDVQLRTLARITDNSEERAQIEAKIEELRQAIQRETGAVHAPAERVTLDDVERELFALERQRKATRDSRERAGIEAQLVALEQKREELRAAGASSEPQQSQESQEPQKPGSAESAQAEQVPVVPLEEARAAFEHAAARYDSLSGSEGVFGKGRAEIALAAYLAAIDRQVKELRAEKKHGEVKKMREAEDAVLSRYKASQFSTYQVSAHRGQDTVRTESKPMGRPAGAPAPEQSTEAPQMPESASESVGISFGDALVALAVAKTKWKQAPWRSAEKAALEAALERSRDVCLESLKRKVGELLEKRKQELTTKGISGTDRASQLVEYYEQKLFPKLVTRLLREVVKMLPSKFTAPEEWGERITKHAMETIQV